MNRDLLYVDDAGEHRWHVIADNGEKISASTESYKRAIDAKAGAVITLRKLLEQLPAEDVADVIAAWREENHALVDEHETPTPPDRLDDDPSPHPPT